MTIFKVIRWLILTTVIFAASGAMAKVVAYEQGVDYANYLRFDRYLDVEIWVDDEAYYQGEEIAISFKANKNCYVAIYNIDSRGEISLIYPAGPNDDHWIKGGRVYRIPDRYDEYRLTVQGPTGVEYLQIVASRNPFVIPNWTGGSGLVCDDDPYDYLDYINATFFNCDFDCPRAFDLTSFVVKEWHNYYFRPIHSYHYDYWDWDYCGSVYIDYPFGATIYIDGVYWGIAPLFIPRIYYGWHYVTIYDHYGYCWEDRINFIQRRSLVIDETVIRPKADVRSRFKEVRTKGYLNPAGNGYPQYKKEVRIKENYKPIASKSSSGRYKYAVEKSVKSIRESSYKSSNRGAYKTDNSYRRSYDKIDRRSKAGSRSSTVDKRQKSKSSDKSYRSKSSESGGKSGTVSRKKSSGGSDSRVKTKSTTKSSSGSKQSNGSVKSTTKSSTTKKSSGGSSGGSGKKRR